MAIVGIAKRAIRAAGLRSAAASALRTYSKFRPHHVCVRGGIRYDLDLSEVIDFGIFTGGWEPSTIRFLENNVSAGDVVLEVGANIGAHTLLIAKLVGPEGAVYAFEPTEFALNKLRRNLSLNPHLADVVVLRQNLVTNHELATPSRAIKSSWPVHRVGKPQETVTVGAVALDDFVAEAKLSKVSLLKVDVDGYDYKVLDGARGMLSRYRPIVFVELSEYALNEQNDSTVDILSLFKDLGYEAYSEDGQRLDGPDTVLKLVGPDSSINAIFRPLS